MIDVYNNNKGKFIHKFTKNPLIYRFTTTVKDIQLNSYDMHPINMNGQKGTKLQNDT